MKQKRLETRLKQSIDVEMIENSYKTQQESKEY